MKETTLVSLLLNRFEMYKQLPYINVRTYVTRCWQIATGVYPVSSIDVRSMVFLRDRVFGIVCEVCVESVE